MARARPVDVAVTLGFLAILAAPAVIQAIVEARAGERPRALEVFLRAPTKANLHAYEKELEEESRLASYLRPWMQLAELALLEDGGEKVSVGLDGWLFYRPSVRYFLERTALGRRNPDGERKTSTPQGSGPRGSEDPLPAIVAFRDALASRGIRLLLLPVPNKETIYPEKMASRAASLTVAVAPRTRELMERLLAAGVEVVDLFEAFRAAKGGAGGPSGMPLYLRQDTHWSPAGIEVAAATVGTAVLRTLDLGDGGGAGTRYAARPLPVRRMGDLVRMLRLPERTRFAEPEDITCRQVVREDDGSPYRDDPHSEVLLVGDSFLRVFETDEPGAAGFVAHLAMDLGRPLASLVSDGGGSTLAREELARRREILEGKRLVVWEFVERDIQYGLEGWRVVPLD